MSKTILITGATDGIGLETAKRLYSEGHNLLLHGRNAQKLATTEKTVANGEGAGRIDTYNADLSCLTDVNALAEAILKDHDKLDVVINNAGVMRVARPLTRDGLDVRFAVNTLAPYLLTRRLLPLAGPGSRVVNLSSAAQAPVQLEALKGEKHLSDDMAAYAQSKLALTMWNNALARSYGNAGPVFVAVNPGSLLASKMVREGFGVAGKSLSIGTDILVRAALSEEFASASGLYFDNDKGQFGSPHPDALHNPKCATVVAAIDELIDHALS